MFGTASSLTSTPATSTFHGDIGHRRRNRKRALDRFLCGESEGRVGSSHPDRLGQFQLEI